MRKEGYCKTRLDPRFSPFFPVFPIPARFAGYAKKHIAKQDLTPVFLDPRFYRPEILRTTIDADFDANLRDASPQYYGRIYVAGWQTRNLRMVANVRAAFRESPGARVLSIVGSSHKPWFAGLLGRMQGVQVVDAEKALK